jgi:hypothetical protein
MPSQPFKVHVDPDALARQDLAAAVSLPPVAKDADQPGGSTGAAEEHHGARDARLAARQHSERAHAGRASGAGGGRSYAFRRS